MALAESLSSPIAAAIAAVLDHHHIVTPVTVESVAYLHNGALGNPISRSRCRRLIVTFSGEATIADAACTVQKRGGSFTTVAQSISVVDGKSVATLTFSGNNVEFGSLNNGNYELVVLSSKVAGLAEDYHFGDVFEDDFFVLFADLNGDGVSTAPGEDYDIFIVSFGAPDVNAPKYREDADQNNDGDIDGSDFGWFVPGATRTPF